MTHPRIADAALVHGAGIQPTIDGWELTPGSQARFDVGVRKLENGEVDHLFFCGKNAHGDDLPATEAGLMAEQARILGIGENSITIEENSTSMVGNLTVLGTAKDQGMDSIIGVTSSTAVIRGTHFFRAINNGWHLGLSLRGYVSSGEAEKVTAIPREAVALVMGRHCINRALRDGVPLCSLDQYYTEQKARSGLATIKRRFANYAY